MPGCSIFILERSASTTSGLYAVSSPIRCLIATISECGSSSKFIAVIISYTYATFNISAPRGIISGISPSFTISGCSCFIISVTILTISISKSLFLVNICIAARWYVFTFLSSSSERSALFLCLKFIGIIRVPTSWSNAATTTSSCFLNSILSLYAIIALSIAVFKECLYT